MNIGFLWNIITSPRSTIVGLVGSVSAGAALLFVLNAMGCDLSKLTMDVLTEAAAMVSAPAIVGGVMRDKKKDNLVPPGPPTAGDEAHVKEGGNSF